MTKIILTDVDDTVLQCARVLEDFCAARVGDRQIQSLEGRTMEEAFGLSVEETTELLNAFWADAIFDNLAPMPCASEVLPRLHAQGWRFVAITACLDTEEMVQRRRDNLRRAFGFDWVVHCVGRRGSKSEFLRAYPPTLWVEDNERNAEAGRDAGHFSTLLRPEPLPFTAPAGVTAVRDWHDIEAILHAAQQGAAE